MSGWGLPYNGALEKISPLSHPASPIQPPPLRGTSFHRKEGVSTRAPSLGRGCRAQRGGVGFLFGRRSRLLFDFPLGKVVVSRKAVSPYRSLPHWGRGTALAVDRVLSYNGALEKISPLFHPASPIQPPPLPLEGAAERSEAGLASFLGGEAAFSLPFPLGKALCREKRYPPIAPFPIGEGGPRSGARVLS